MSVTLSSWEVEIRKIMIPGQAGLKKKKSLCSPTSDKKKSGINVHSSHLSNTTKYETRGLGFKWAWEQKGSYLKMQGQKHLETSLNQ
jgi:hypothetical protein